MAGKPRLLGALFVLTLSCGQSQTKSPAPAEPKDAVTQRQEVLASITTRVILPTYAEFEQDLGVLKAATTALRAAPEDGAALQVAQNAWRQAMRTWQRAEVFQVGPAGAMDLTPGGEDLRDAIYSWPLASTCVVDQTLAREEYTDLAKKTITARGLDALEYLLFYTGPKNTCAPNSAINASGDWDTLTPGDLATRRAAYGDLIVEGVQQAASALHTFWRADGGNFGDTFSQGNRAPYGSTQEALNALSDAMFYLEEETKDMKLAKPAGFKDCQGACPDALEFRYAKFSREAVQANLEGFKLVYFGGPDKEQGKGFDDLLMAAMSQELDQKLQGLIATLETTLKAAPSFSASLAAGGDPEPVRRAYTQAKAIGDVLKTDFLSVLDLELPQRAEGDND